MAGLFIYRRPFQTSQMPVAPVQEMLEEPPLFQAIAVAGSHTFTEQCFDPYGFPCRNLGLVAYLWSFSSIDVGFCIPSKAVG